MVGLPNCPFRIASKGQGMCGALVNDPGHLWNPCADKKKCFFCGATDVDARHVCRDKLTAMKYVCDGCRRVAMEAEHLCKPSAISAG
jgi:hypothetical protein